MGILKMTDNKDKTLSMLREYMSEEPLVRFSQMTLQDIPLISKLLMSVWPQHYPKAGFPVFSEDYLQWVLGGPNKDKHLLFGGVMNDELVAYQSLLFRKISYCGNRLNAYLCTHVTISHNIDFRLRMDCGLQMGAQYALLHKDSKYFDPNCDLVYGFAEDSESLRSFGDRLLKQYLQIDRKTFSIFNQFMVMPNLLKTYLLKNPIGKSFFIRPASEKDSDQLEKLFNHIPEVPHFIMLMTEDELKHHFFGHPAHRTFIIEDYGTIRAFINFYPLEFVKRDKTYTYIIIEFLVSEHDNKTYASALLQEAVAFAEEIGAKGVVFENATYLDQDKYQKIGLIPTFRKMAMSLISKSHPIDYSGTFRCDVK